MSSDTVHVSLAELRAMDDGSALETEWITSVRVRWAARRAAASEGEGSGVSIPGRRYTGGA